MVEVSVIKAFTFEGRSLRAGDKISMEPVAASIFARQFIGFVSLSRNYNTAALSPEPEPQPKRRRAYRRRDMQAEA